jgi:hypothetical protein
MVSMASNPILIANEGKVHPAYLPEELEAILKEPFLVQMLVFDPTALAFMAYASEQKENGYSRDDLMLFAAKTFRDVGFGFTLWHPTVGRIQYNIPEKKYDPTLDVERSLDVLLDAGIFTEKRVLIEGVSENRYFLIPPIAKYLNASDFGADFFKQDTFENLFYEFPEIMDRVDKKLRLEYDPDTKNT